jgi:hypothetical protein
MRPGRLYYRYGAWRYFPLQGPACGDLWLTVDGRLGYSRVNWMSGVSWDTTVSEVKDVSRVGPGIYAWCGELRHSASLEADFAGQRYLIHFTASPLSCPEPTGLSGASRACGTPARFLSARNRYTRTAAPRPGGGKRWKPGSAFSKVRAQQVISLAWRSRKKPSGPAHKH